MGFQQRDRDPDEFLVHVERGGGDRPALRITVVDTSGRVVIAELSFAPNERLDVASFELGRGPFGDGLGRRYG